MNPRCWSVGVFVVGILAVILAPAWALRVMAGFGVGWIAGLVATSGGTANDPPTPEP